MYVNDRSRSITRSISPPRNTIRSISPPRNITKLAIPIISHNNSKNLNNNEKLIPKSQNNNNEKLIPRSPNNGKSPIKVIPQSPRRLIPQNSNKEKIIPRSPSRIIPKNINKVIHELILREWQIQWAKRAHIILLSNHFYIDTSPMRSGKTFVALQLAKDFDLELMVICPPTTKNYWKNMANKYEVPLFTEPVSYEALVRGINNDIVQLYLKRTNNTSKVSYEATPKYIEALKTRKIFLILDEGQMIKNNCQQHKACNALIQPIISGGGRSRFGILSGTLIDKPEQIINLFRTIGYIRSEKLYNNIKGSKTVDLQGTQELIDVCKQIDLVATKKLLNKIPIPTKDIGVKIKDEIDDFCFALYVEIVKPKVSGAMSAPTTADGKLYVKNGYFHIHPKKSAQLANALSELGSHSGYKKKKNSEEEEEPKKSHSKDYIEILVQIEKSKLFDMARVAKKILAEDPANKVVITINYTGDKTQNLPELLSYLTEFDPLVIVGKTIMKQRDIIIEEFNTDPNKRILIAHPKPISVGINLADNILESPNSPRFMLVSPSAKLMEIVQLSSRLDSDQLKTDAHVMIFYAITENENEAKLFEFISTKDKNKTNKGTKIDNNVKEILKKKSDIMGKMQETEIRKNMKLPSDYEDEYEDEGEVFY